MVFCSETRNLNCGIPEIKSKKDGILDRKRYSFFKCGRFKPRTHNFRLYDYRVSKKQLLIRAIPFFERLFGAPFSSSVFDVPISVINFDIFWRRNSADIVFFSIISLASLEFNPR